MTALRFFMLSLKDEFNLRLVAQHLRGLILYDYPDAAILHPTDIQ